MEGQSCIDECFFLGAHMHAHEITAEAAKMHNNRNSYTFGTVAVAARSLYHSLSRWPVGGSQDSHCIPIILCVTMELEHAGSGHGLAHSGLGLSL